MAKEPDPALPVALIVEVFNASTAFPPEPTQFQFPWFSGVPFEDDATVDRNTWFYFCTQRLSEEPPNGAPWGWFARLAQFGVIGIHRLRPRGLAKKHRIGPPPHHDYVFAFKSSRRRDQARLHVEQTLNRRCHDWHQGGIVGFLFTTVMNWTYIANVYADGELDSVPGLRTQLLHIAPRQWTTQALFKEVTGINGEALHNLNSATDRYKKQAAEAFDIPSGRSSWIGGGVIGLNPVQRCQMEIPWQLCRQFLASQSTLASWRMLFTLDVGWGGSACIVTEFEETVGPEAQLIYQLCHSAYHAGVPQKQSGKMRDKDVLTASSSGLTVLVARW